MLRVTLSNYDWIAINIIILDNVSIEKFRLYFSNLINNYHTNTIFLNRKWVIKPHRNRKGLIELINDEGFTLEININEKAFNDYPIVINLKKPERKGLPCLLWEMPVIVTQEIITDLRKEYELDYNIKRIDLACHFQGWIPRLIDAENYQGYSISPYKPGKIFTGFKIGTNRSKTKNVSGTLYNIEERIKDIPGSYIPYQYYNANYVQIDPTWNLEFKVYRSMLKKYNIEKIEDVMDKIPAIWEYLTTKGLRYIIPTIMDTNKSRWKTDPNWIEIQKAFGDITIPIMRNKNVPIMKMPLTKKMVKIESAMQSFIADCEYWDMLPEKKLEMVLGMVDMTKFTNEAIQLYIRNRREIRN